MLAHRAGTAPSPCELGTQSGCCSVSLDLLLLQCLHFSSVQVGKLLPYNHSWLGSGFCCDLILTSGEVHVIFRTRRERYHW